jgi:hypothetical protein
MVKFCTSICFLVWRMADGTLDFLSLTAAESFDCPSPNPFFESEPCCEGDIERESRGVGGDDLEQENKGKEDEQEKSVRFQKMSTIIAAMTTQHLDEPHPIQNSKPTPPPLPPLVAFLPPATVAAALATSDKSINIQSQSFPLHSSAPAIPPLPPLNMSHNPQFSESRQLTSFPPLTSTCSSIERPLPPVPPLPPPSTISSPIFPLKQQSERPLPPLPPPTMEDRFAKQFYY